VKYNSIYNKFSSGELSPYLKGRTDLEEYFSGVDDMTNFLPLKQGGAYFRPGTTNVSVDITTRNFNNRIFKFNPADGFSYIVFASPGSSLAISRIDGGGLTNCTITKPTTIWNKYPDFTLVAGAVTASFDLIDNLNFTSYGDLFVICDGTGVMAPIVGKRTGATTFIIDSYLFPTLISPTTGVLDLDVSAKYPIRFPFKDTNIDAGIKLKPSAVTGNITITSENATGTPINFFTGDVIGMMVKITHAAQGGVARIVSKVSDSVVNAQVVIVSFGATTASTNWEISAFNAIDGYPRNSCFFQGRLFFGGNIKFPDTLWASFLGNIYHLMSKKFIQDATADVSSMNYFGPLKDSDPFNFTLAATVANSIQWMYPSQTLLVGTTGNEYSISGGTDSVLSISNIEAAPLSSHGSARVNPVKVGSSILFVSYDRKRLLELPKDLRQYTSATDLTSLSEGIIDKSLLSITDSAQNKLFNLHGISEMAFQESEGILWCLCRTYSYRTTSMVSLVMDKTTKTLGWSKHTFPMGSTFATISGIASIPIASQNNRDFLYLYTNRPNSFFSLERMWMRTRQTNMNTTDSFDTVTASYGCNHLDYAKLFTATSDTVSIGNQYGSTRDVSVISYQGEYLGEFTPSLFGDITVPGAVAKSPLLVGYKYTGTIKTMPIEAGAQFGVAQGSSRRGHEISVFLDRSRGGKYSQSLSPNEYPLDTTGTAAVLKTGEIKLSLNASPNDTQTIIKQDLPYPLTVLWLLTKGYTYDA
jgi:hypothetical protein